MTSDPAKTPLRMTASEFATCLSLMAAGEPVRRAERMKNRTPRLVAWRPPGWQAGAEERYRQRPRRLYAPLRWGQSAGSRRTCGVAPRCDGRCSASHGRVRLNDCSRSFAPRSWRRCFTRARSFFRLSALLRVRRSCRVMSQAPNAHNPSRCRSP
jgi:hypothetical protein